MGTILFGCIMVPNIEQGLILLLGYSILYKEYNLTGFIQKKVYSSRLENDIAKYLGR